MPTETPAVPATRIAEIKRLLNALVQATIVDAHATPARTVPVLPPDEARARFLAARDAITAEFAALCALARGGDTRQFTGAAVAAFTPVDLHAMSLCVGWVVALSSNHTDDGMHRLSVAMDAMAAFQRVFGDGYHTELAREAAPARSPEETP
jgi:hypothetical protein